MKKFITVILLFAVLMPALAKADTQSELQTQIKVLQLQIQILQLQLQLAQLTNQTSDISSTSSSEPAQYQQVKLYFVDESGLNGERVGCGSGMVGLNWSIPKTITPLKNSLDTLFALKNLNVGETGLTNLLYRSELKVSSASLDQDGVATVNLAGKLQLIGSCADQALAAQITKTATQFPTVKNVHIFVNSKTLEEILSTK